MKCGMCFLMMISLAGSQVYAGQLRWNIPRNERLEIVRTARVDYYINARLHRTHEERNIIDLTCYEQDRDASRVKGVFTVFQRESGETVFTVREQYNADFSITPMGRFIVDAKSYMPNLRHVPSFPDREISTGDTWTAPGELVLNNFSRAFKLIFPVEYVFSGVEKMAGSEIAIIKYKYVIDMDLRGSKYPPDFPVKITGRNDGVIRWDMTQGTPVEYRDKYRIVFAFGTGQTGLSTHEFRMNIDSTNKLYAAVTEKEKEKAREEIRKVLPGNSGIDVDTEKRGLVLRMGEVLFDFDSSAIRADTKATLEKVTALLREKYPDREIIVEGHTDDTGSYNYNQNLSKERARTVAEYLKLRMGHDKFSYRGFGSDRPMAGNDTKEGRRKNRRVEIIIKLH